MKEKKMLKQFFWTFCALRFFWGFPGGTSGEEPTC